MEHITDILRENGFKPYRKLFNTKTKEFYLIPEYEYMGSGFSTMINGGLDIRYIKGKQEVIWGLREYGKPPTLVWPRIGTDDDEANKKLLNTNHLEIFKQYIYEEDL